MMNGMNNKEHDLHIRSSNRKERDDTKGDAMISET